MITLSYPPFASCGRILQAAQNSPFMKIGEQSPAASILQGALIDVGYRMPISTAKTGTPDGKYGRETKSTVHQFQTDQGLGKDGIAGRETISRLDKLLSAKQAPPQPKPAPPKPPMPPPPGDRHYQIGSSDPVIRPDPGSGVFNSVSTEVSMWMLKQAILEILPPRGLSAAAFIGVDASKHMLHYLYASGSELTIDLEGMVDSGPTAKARFRNEVGQAQKFVESLPVGTHDITSKSIESAYNTKNESTNWYFAVGGYSTWGKGVAKVINGTNGPEYELEFEYKFFDRYNWDAGKSVTIAGITITDKFMGEFHRQGLAQEFNMRGSFKRSLRWKKGEVIPEEQLRRGGR